ncbi:YdaS family helix-turn-helix protein [Clostridium sp. 001]|uniref:YdaS family helix-turn-helix protein n=1 Tax=Clostridium sp. 001 TaxID=1970093 RepID=UPI001C2C1876|nr:YdaS family helix-turn-helix protein [Clostridium sp. 001]QXE20023.1 hypothetical protein B5S50_14985 [Clostridium sp. 001]
MIGLEYILALYNINHSKLAEELGIKRQNINQWIRGKNKIPKKYLPIVSKMFNIPEEIFQKELSDIDKLKIQKMKIENEMDETEYEDTIIDEKTGEEITITRTYLGSGEEFYLQNLSYEIQEKELYAKIKRTLDNCFNDDDDSMDGGLHDAWTLLEDFDKFADIMRNENINKNTIRKILLAIRLAYGKGFESDKFIRKVMEAIKEEEEKNKKYLKEVKDLWEDDNQ